MNVNTVQKAIRKAGVDGWLLYDFRHNNELACRFLGLGPEVMLTRRFFYWIPATGTPQKIVSVIEPHHLDHLAGDNLIYHSWQQLEKYIAHVLTGHRTVAMEYSPRNGNPYVSKVDAGTVELVRALGVEVVSSANILQQVTGLWDEEKLRLHREAARVADRVVEEAWQWIASGLRTDYGVQQYILERFAEAGCITEGAPICAVNADSADPHFCPTAATAKSIRSGDFVLIDLWCKKDVSRATYADICRVGVCGQPTAKQQTIFGIVKHARDAATQLVRERFAAAKPLMGWEVDQAARDVIDAAGYGEHFTHRTGHNIDESDHGDGTHLDNLETQDRRLLLPRTCFSIEPGIYLPGEFGVRLEYDIYVHEDGHIEINGGVQEELWSTCSPSPAD